MSLKYRRRTSPFDFFKNFLIFICQALAIVCFSIILAQPYTLSEEIVFNDTEVIVIIDAAANMRAKFAGDNANETRFEKAIRDVKTRIDEVLIEDEGSISIMLAGKTPEYIIQGADAARYSDVVGALDAAKCSNSSSDMDAAFEKAQERLFLNPSAKVWVYSGTEYGNMGDAVTVTNLSDTENEWNVAITGCTPAVEDNEYVFYVDIAAYGNIAMTHMMNISIKGADNGNKNPQDYTWEIPVSFEVNLNSEDLSTKQTLRICATDTEKNGKADWLYTTYEEAVFSFEGLYDSIADDDSITVYGGYKDPINIQYYSDTETGANIFLYFGIQILRDYMRDTRAIELDQVEIRLNQRPALEGFDVYIFEGVIPDEVLENGLPEDGIVFLLNPAENVNDIPNLSVDFGAEVDFGKELNPLFGGMPSPLLNYLSPEQLGITCYRRINGYDPEFEPVLYCGLDPVLIVKNTPSSKIVIMPFDIHRSNFYSGNLQTFLYNFVNYFFPYTVSGYAFDLDDAITVNCKGTSVEVTNEVDEESLILVNFPTIMKLDKLGTYTFITSFDFEGKEDEVRKVFVRIASTESGLFRVAEARVQLMNEDEIKVIGKDLFLYFAIAAFALLFVEWWLHFRGA